MFRRARSLLTINPCRPSANLHHSWASTDPRHTSGNAVADKKGWHWDGTQSLSFNHDASTIDHCTLALRQELSLWPGDGQTGIRAPAAVLDKSPTRASSSLNHPPTHFPSSRCTLDAHHACPNNARDDPCHYPGPRLPLHLQPAPQPYMRCRHGGVRRLAQPRRQS